jgi:O-antigen/teichoic acid export membrane protein
VFKHIASNWSLNLLQIVVMLVLVPVLEADLGRDGYGIWVAIIAATGLLELLSMGVPMASVRHVSEAIGAGDLSRTNRVIATGYGVTLLLGVAGLALGAALYVPFQTKLVDNPEWKSASPLMLDGALAAYVITAIRVAASLALRFPMAVFDAHRDFVTKNIVLGAAILLRAVAVVVLLKTSPSLEGLAWIFVVEGVAVFLVFRVLIRKKFAGVRFELGSFDRSLVRELLGFGVFAAVLNVGSLIAYQLDTLVIGLFIGPDSITDFEIGNKFFLPLANLMFGLGAVVMPTATALMAAGDSRALEHVFLKWSKIALSVILPVGLYLTVLGPEFLAAWVKPEYRDLSGPVTRILAPSFVLYLPVRAVALPILLGTSRPGRAAAMFLLMSLANLGLSIGLVKAGYGIVGVALGTAVPQVLYALYLLAITCLHLKVGLASWLRYVGGRALIGSLVPLGFLLFLERGLGVQGFPQLIASGVAMMLLYGAVWVFFVYRGDPYLDLRAELRQRVRARSVRD